MRTPEEVDRVLGLFARGATKSEIVRDTGIPYRTISHWISGDTPTFGGGGGALRYLCPICAAYVSLLPRRAYMYLLGLYLGDGCVYRMPKGVYRLGIFCADAYPSLIQECEDAMAAVLPTRVGRVHKIG